jgi:hypothetical protein
MKTRLFGNINEELDNDKVEKDDIGQSVSLLEETQVMGINTTQTEIDMDDYTKAESAYLKNVDNDKTQQL